MGGRFGKGCIKDVEDKRDLPILQLHQRMGVVVQPLLPTSIDLRDFCPPVYDQQSLGACTGFGISSGVEAMRQQAGLPYVQLSQEALYYLERQAEGDVGQDGGAQIRTGLSIALKSGIPPYSDYPYDPATFTTPPTPQALTDAQGYKIGGYFRLWTVRQFQRTMAWKHFIVMGVDVFESFEGLKAEKTGVIPMPGPNEQLLGGHCILGVGYDDSKQVIIFRNSWSDQWGDKGYGYLPYEYLEKQSVAQGPYVSDMWAITLSTDGK